MPEINANRRIDRPAEGFATARLPGFADRPVRMFVPTDYQPLYAYPLVVLFHGRDSDEEQCSRLAPRFSRRNSLALSLRGSQCTGRRDDGRSTFTWGSSREEQQRTTEYLLAAVEHTRQSYHIHAERLFLVGVNEGAETAYRIGLSLADRIAGIAAINGRIPHDGVHSLLGSPRRLPVLMAHGSANPIVPLTAAKQDYRRLVNAGADVRFASYPTTQRLHPNMLRDVNRWIIGRVMESKAGRTSDM